MICDSCKTDRLVNDFLNNSNICYKCVYRKKLEISPGKKILKTVFCRICKKEVIKDKELKKRQRNVYCSYECAEIGGKEQREKHWTRKFLGNKMWLDDYT
jgi:hypothetical protein